MGLFDKPKESSMLQRHPLPSAPQSEVESVVAAAPSPAEVQPLLASLSKICWDEDPFAGQLRREMPSPIEYVRLLHLPRLSDDQGNPLRVQTRERALLTGLNALSVPFVFRFENRRNEIHVLLGTGGGNGSSANLGSATLTVFPGCDFTPVEKPSAPDACVAAVVTGTPQQFPEGAHFAIPDLGNLVAALPTVDLGFTLAAKPVTRRRIQQLTSEISASLRQWSVHLHEGYDLSQNTQVISKSFRRETTNREVQQAIDSLEILLQRYIKGSAEGLWEWQGVLWAADSQSLTLLSSLFLSLFSGPESLPQPLRISPLGKTDVPTGDLLEGNFSADCGGQAASTFLTTSLLASLLRFPRKSFAGFRTAGSASFATAEPRTISGPAWTAGAILDEGRDTERRVSFGRDDLCSHALVVGMTGAGKSNTCMAVLKELDKLNVPFLVIEPAKSEYRSLLRVPQFQDRLRVFTLGNESLSPFRLNPFEIPEGYNVSTHIDFLKSVFMSAFSMYGPMPQILEEAVVRVYLRRGWDLATGLNVHAGQVDRAFLFPTLSDLLTEIDAVIKAIGYAEELTMDMRGALRARVRSLLVGAKGLMLGSQKSTPLDDLLRVPTILELHALGDDQEKAFLMGLLLVRLYEHRQTSHPATSELQHVTLIEEAHRILKNVSTVQSNQEIANVVGKAVDTFNNILAEIRAYGEGILIAEQIPSKLSPDAIKNTGLKIVHRLHALDDRQGMAGTILLNRNQEQHVAILPPLTSLMFGAGLEEATCVAISPSKPEFSSGFRPVKDHDIRDHMRSYAAQSCDTRELFAACCACPNKCSRSMEAAELLEQPDHELSRTFRRIVVAWSLPENVSPAPLHLRNDYCLLAHLTHTFVSDRVDFYGLNLVDRVNLERCLVTAATSGPGLFREALGRFLELWRPILVRQWERRKRYCSECEAGLCIGSDLDTKVQDAGIVEAFADSESDEDVRRFLSRISHEVVGSTDSMFVDRLGYCYFIRMYSERGIRGAEAVYREIMAGEKT